jgi:hypothetical protein
LPQTCAKERLATNVTALVTFYTVGPSRHSSSAAADDHEKKMLVAGMDPQRSPQRYVPPRCNESA